MDWDSNNEIHIDDDLKINVVAAVIWHQACVSFGVSHWLIIHPSPLKKWRKKSHPLSKASLKEHMLQS
jgi:hypothetical protein